MPIDRFRGGSQSGRDKLNSLVDSANAVGQLRGDEVFIAVRRGPGGGATVALNIDAVVARVPKPWHSHGERFYARIMGSASAGDNKWTYSWSERVKTNAGYGGWTEPENARAGSYGFNMMEDMNSDTGVQGNGVDVANLDTEDYTFTIQPIPAGVIVEMLEVSLPDEDATKEYWFSASNGVDGACD